MLATSIYASMLAPVKHLLEAVAAVSNDDTHSGHNVISCKTYADKTSESVAPM